LSTNNQRDKGKNWSLVPDVCLTSRQTGRLTVGRNITLATTKSSSKTKLKNCGLVVRVLGYRSRGPGSILGTTRKKNVVGLERGALSLVSTTEELLDRKVAAPV
jgi:hypothetical protein